MKRNIAALGLGVLTLLAVAGPVRSDEAGSTETQTVKRSCGADASKQYSPESGKDLNECKNPATGQLDPSREYNATYYSNDVKCGNTGKVADAPVGTVYAAGNPSGPSGHTGICADGDEQVKVVEGRAMLAGSDDEGGLHLVVDGDKSNSQSAARGWIKVGGTTAGPYVQCGDDNGRLDSDNATPDDTQADCG